MLGLILFWSLYHYNNPKNVYTILDAIWCPIGIYLIQTENIYRIYEYNIWLQRMFYLAQYIWLGRMLAYHWYMFQNWTKYYAVYFLLRSL